MSALCVYVSVQLLATETAIAHVGRGVEAAASDTWKKVKEAGGMSEEGGSVGNKTVAHMTHLLHMHAHAGKTLLSGEVISTWWFARLCSTGT